MYLQEVKPSPPHTLAFYSDVLPCGQHVPSMCESTSHGCYHGYWRSARFVPGRASKASANWASFGPILAHNRPEEAPDAARCGPRAWDDMLCSDMSRSRRSVTYRASWARISVKLPRRAWNDGISTLRSPYSYNYNTVLLCHISILTPCTYS